MEPLVPTADDLFDRRLGAATERVRLFVRLRLGSALRSRFEPEDVLQETCAAALRARERYDDRGDEAFVKWVCRISETTIRSMAEREGAAKRTPPGECGRLSVILGIAGDSATGPVTAADRAERNERLARAMESLPDDEREALLGRFFLDRTFEEIGEAAGIGTTSARRLVGRATKRLGERLR
jgi:RNA polymerase sigma-70 factor, ECF subfamily